MIISVASGKGGTGKTTVAASLAKAVSNAIYMDCDVEEPNGHLMLNPVLTDETIVEKPVPVFNLQKCSYCNKCVEVCEFNAIMIIKEDIILFDDLCHSCGACLYFCPENAITETGKKIGVIRSGDIENSSVKFIDGVLNIGESSATSLIRELKNKVEQHKNFIIDSPPGTACSMVETVRGSDFCILVTEPTPFGMHDLILAIEVIKILKIPFGVVINKNDLGFNELVNYLNDNHIAILQKIPFERKIAELYSKGILPFEDPEYKKLFIDLFDKVQNLAMNKGNR